MLFVRRPVTTVVVNDSAANRAAAQNLAEERGQVNGAAATLAVVALIAVLLALAYFVWWAPSNTVQVQTPVIHDTQVVDRPVPGNTTIVNNPPNVTPPPQVIHEQHDHVIEVPVPTQSNGSTTTAGASTGTTTGGTDSGAGSGSTGG
jgi:hypothetical protein